MMGHCRYQISKGDYQILKEETLVLRRKEESPQEEETELYDDKAFVVSNLL